jgi:hypothetical protein
MNEKIDKIISFFESFPKKYWDTTHLTGEDHDLRRSKPAPYIKSTIEIAKLLGMKTAVEIGSTRMAFSKKCLDYYKEELDPFISPSCCADGHGGVLFTLEGFEVYSVDIDMNCITQNKWSFENINMPYPSNLHLNIPKDGIEFLRDFQDKIDVLYLDGWDINTINYKEKHLEAFEVAKDKLSDLHLILIDDTDFTLVGEGKDALLSPHLIEKGYIKLFDGRQTLYINRMPNENEIIEIVDPVNSYDDIVKMIDNNPRVTLSLTTVPQRLEQNREGWGVKPVIDKLLNLNYENYEIHFNIPYINRKLNKEYVIPEWLLEYEKTYEKLKIFRCHDYGPLTKLAPTLLRLQNDNDIVITVDDDLMYIDGFIEEHLEKRKKYPNMAIGFAGIGSVDGSCHFCTTLERDTRVKILEGYKTVSYLKKFFKEDFFNHFANQSWSDDIIISAYLGKENIEKWVVNYSGDKDFRAVVESFPVLNHLPNDKSGCWEFRKNNEDDNSHQWYKLKYLER